jgi:two-component system LytT family response regulator
MSDTVRVLIVDDELLARQRLEDLLTGRNGIEVIGLASNGQHAIDAINELAPDLVFLDVQMPGLNGFDVVRNVGPDAMPATIFVTAYDQYALNAFDVAALDYLVKPFDDDRFEQAFERACELVRLRKVNTMTDELLTLLQRTKESNAAPSAAPSASRFLQRIAVEMRGQVRVVRVSQIDFITASGPYAELHVEDETYLIRERMQTLEERLDPGRFFRIHRSTIVQLDRVEALLISGGGDYAVRLKDGRRLQVSRSRKEELEQRLGLDALK